MSSYNTESKIYIVANGDPGDRTVVSGVPRAVLNAAEAQLGPEQVHGLNAKPPRILRWAIRALTFSWDRQRWNGKYVHGTLMTVGRSLMRDVQLLRSSRHDHVLHVRSWYMPSRRPYSAFIDATGGMLQGQSQEWSPPARTFKSKVRLERRFYSEAKHIFVASRAARVSLMCDYGIEPERIVFVGGGRNQPGISFLDDGELQRRLTDGIILFVGKDQERKGLQYLVAAIRELRELGCDYKLCIVGPLTLPKELVDEEWIDFKGRVTSPEVLQRVFRQAALFCLPSLQEAFGLVVPEAMSYGLPVIVTDVGEMPEIVRDRVDGIIVPSAEVEPLVQAMIEIMSNREHYARFSQSSHERSEGFTWTAVVERMIEVLRD